MFWCVFSLHNNNDKEREQSVYRSKCVHKPRKTKDGGRGKSEATTGCANWRPCLLLGLFAGRTGHAEFYLLHSSKVVAVL